MENLIQFIETALMIFGALVAFASAMVKALPAINKGGWVNALVKIFDFASVVYPKIKDGIKPTEVKPNASIN